MPPGLAEIALRSKKRMMLRIACGMGCVAACGVLGLLAVVTALGVRMEALKFPPSLGNGEANIRTAVERAGEGDFVFHVLSDPQRGSGTLRALLGRIAPERPAFVVICGDVVADPEHKRHKFFSTLVAEAELPCPVFVIPGNHCAAADGEGDFTGEDYVRTYGPMQYHFVAGGRLFLFLNNAAPRDKTGDFINYARRVLDEQAGKASEAVIFMHVPVAGISPEITHPPNPRSKAFGELADGAKVPVRYVFMGHHHAYLTHERGQTTYVVCGGAGGTLRGTHGRFHHAVRMAVTGEKMSQTLIETDETTGLWGRCERVTVLHIWPLIIAGPAGWAVTGLTALAAAGLLVFCVRKLHGGPATTTQR